MKHSCCHAQMIPGTDEYRFNFWGYSTVNFFSPMARYSQVTLYQARGPCTAHAGGIGTGRRRC